VRSSLALHHKLGYLFGKANAYTNLGVLYHAQGRWKEAAESYERSDWIRREIGYLIGRASNLKNLACLRIAMGHHEQARKDLQMSLSISQRLGEDLDAIHALMGLIHLAVIEEQFDEAERLLGDIRSHDLSSLGSSDLALITSNEAIVSSHRRSPADGVHLALNALKTAQASGVPETEADCRLVLGMLHARDGNFDAAEEVLRQSLSLVASIGDPYRTGLTLLELGRAAQAPYDQDRALAALQSLESSRLVTESQ